MNSIATRPQPIAWLKEHPFAGDVILAAIVTAIMVPAPWVSPEEVGVTYRDVDVLAPILMLASSVPIAWRRRSPLVVLAIVATAAVIYEVLAYPTTSMTVGVLVALYTVAAHCDRRRSLYGFAATMAGVGLVLLTARWEVGIDTVVSNVIIFVTVWVIGDNLRTRRAYVESLSERAKVAEETRAAEAERAVIDERHRIARELHDSPTRPPITDGSSETPSPCASPRPVSNSCGSRPPTATRTCSARTP